MTTIVTHNGHFHADELLAVATLLLKYPDAKVVRSRDEEIVSKADVAVDVGRVYDPQSSRFDHHQTEGAGVRENGIPYASFGLVWKEHGEEIAGGPEQAKIIEEKVVLTIDAHDNGIQMCAPVFEGVHEYSIGDYFESFASQVETMEGYDSSFAETLPIAKKFLTRLVSDSRCTVESWKETRSVYEASENKNLIVLPQHTRWKHVLIPTEAIFVVYPRPDGHWAAQAVPKSLSGFENKKMFPASWAGKDNQELAEASGVPDALFCHRNCFLATAETKDGALKLAEIALNS